MGIWKGKLDAFGKEIYDHFRGVKAVYEIAERDDGWIDLSTGPDCYFAAYRDWSELDREAISFARGRVMDVGCGAGRVALHLQGKGHEVLGIDNSELALRTCRLRGLKSVRAMTLSQVSGRLGVFDTVVMFGNNFGLFENFRRARWLLRRLHTMTSPAARILANTFDPYQTKQPAHRAYQARNRRAGRMGAQVRIRIRYRDCATPWFDYLIASPGEMGEIVRGTGWQIGRLLKSGGTRYTAVLEKDVTRSLTP